MGIIPDFKYKIMLSYTSVSFCICFVSRTAFDVSLTDDSWTKDTFEIVSGNTSISWERLDAYAFLVLEIVSLVQFMEVRSLLVIMLNVL